MRCAAAGWVTDDPQEAYRLGGETAAPSHNHPEGMEAAGVTACMICAARGGADRESLRAYAAAHYEIPTIAELEGYEFTEASRLTMPAVFAAFFESTDFEDCIRRAVAIGGDSDTIAAIAGSIAEAFYGIPQELIAQACDFLPDHLQETLLRFEDTFAL